RGRHFLAYPGAPALYAFPVGVRRPTGGAGVEADSRAAARRRLTNHPEEALALLDPPALNGVQPWARRSRPAPAREGRSARLASMNCWCHNCVATTPTRPISTDSRWPDQRGNCR